jgi:hypothetical protein
VDSGQSTHNELSTISCHRLSGSVRFYEIRNTKYPSHVNWFTYHTRQWYNPNRILDLPDHKPKLDEMINPSHRYQPILTLKPTILGVRVGI